MKRIAIPLLLLVAACTSPTPSTSPTATADNNAWLRQLVGEWTISSRTVTEPGGEPALMEGTESMRSLGDQWIVAEGVATLGGQPFTSLMTLGYDPATDGFVGTWIDSMETHLWVYQGSLDPSGKVLTLNTEGPGFNAPSRTDLYRDTIDLESSDHRVLTSSVRNADGTWTQFLTVDYRRKR